MVTWDPAHLTQAQRDGEACAVCDKRWPRPTAQTGQLPGGTPVYACPECIPLPSERKTPA